MNDEESPRAGELPRKRRWLLEQLPVAGVCVEIGVWQGDFSHWILELTRPRTLHLVDPWAVSHAEQDRRTKHGAERSGGQEALDAVFHTVATRFAAEIARQQVIVHRLPSAAAAGLFADATFDWIYVDGDHSYDAVRSDLALWERTVKAGGIIAGDDYRRGRNYGSDVIRAVDEFAAARGLSVTSWGRQFLIRLPG